jgi:hypothetical protein
MSIVDKVKDFLGRHGDQVDKVIEKAGDIADEKTGGKYADKIDQAQGQAKRMAGHGSDQSDEERRRP